MTSLAFTTGIMKYNTTAMTEREKTVSNAKERGQFLCLLPLTQFFCMLLVLLQTLVPHILTSALSRLQILML